MQLQLGERFSSSAFFGGDRRLGPMAESPPATDADRCDRDSLLGAYGGLAPRVQRFLRDLLGCPATAADATQETFVRAFRKLADVDALPPGTKLAPWVFGIARHVSLEVRKARGRAGRVLIQETPEHAERIADARMRSPETQLLDRESLEVIGRALDQLPEERRAALLLRLDHGLAYDEIATTMGWTLAKAKVEIFRAREVLRATLADYRGGAS
jgi:RNA polymerase sigma-70 factor (ECF subfamily)